MKIFGHPWIASEILYSVSNIEEIKQTPSNALLQIDIFSTNIELVHYCHKNHLHYAVKILEIKEAIFANSLGAKFILCSQKLAKELMPIAQNYLFDAQVIAYILEDSEINEMAKIEVDGVILSNNGKF